MALQRFNDDTRKLDMPLLVGEHCTDYTTCIEIRTAYVFKQIAYQGKKRGEAGLNARQT